jgi:rod shape determining protein RodA
MNLTLQMQERGLLKKIDWPFALLIFGLNIIGLFNLFSATHGPLSQEVESLFISQIMWLMIGWSVFFIITFIDYQVVSRIAYLVYVINLGAILYVTFFGKVALGAQRWIDLGFFRYQPSETMKLAMIVVLSKVFAQRAIDHEGMGVKELIWPIFLFVIPFGLVVEQPDLGTAMMIGAISASIILFMHIRRWILVSLAVLLMFALPVAWNYVLRDYQKARITNFINPGNDPRGSGYNSIQSKIAVGSGKWVGKGFRQGTQSQLEFLPERHTDFIFSVLSEEFGFVGSMLTLILFLLLFGLGLRIAATARDKFGALLSVGVLSYMFWAYVYQYRMVIGLLPIVGVPLPLLSYAALPCSRPWLEWD